MISDKTIGENNPFYNKTHTEESRIKISKSNTGKSKLRTEEHNNKIGKSNLGKIHTLIICVHCGKKGGVSSMKRWHFNNCRDKSDK